MPLIIPFVIYLVLLVGFIIFSLFILYHLLKFGFVGDLTHVMAALYIVLALIILVPTFVYGLSVDWLHGSIDFTTITLRI